MVYAVYNTYSFEKEVEGLSPSDKEIIQNMCIKLKDNPYVGDQIRYRFFREKRIKEKRIYFLIYQENLKQFSGCSEMRISVSISDMMIYLLF